MQVFLFCKIRYQSHFLSTERPAYKTQSCMIYSNRLVTLHLKMFLQEDGLRNFIILRLYEYYKVVQCNLLHFIKLYYMDVLAKVSSESVILFRVRIACRKYDQPSIYYEASKCDQYEKKHFLKNSKYFLSERRISGCLLYTSPSPRDLSTSRMPSSA